MSPSTLLRQFVNAPRAGVYSRLIDPQAISIWMVPDDMTSLVHHFDPRQGGEFRISLTYDEPGAQGKTTLHTDTYHGHFVKLIPDERVVEVLEFETSDPGMQGEMTFTLTEVEGVTEVLALHENLAPALSPADNETGWRMALEKLARLAEG
jgi:uncharacterized protein YndB with AHSA1/START domain